MHPCIKANLKFLANCRVASPAPLSVARNLKRFTSFSQDVFRTIAATVSRGHFLFTPTSNFVSHCLFWLRENRRNSLFQISGLISYCTLDCKLDVFERE